MRSCAFLRPPPIPNGRCASSPREHRSRRAIAKYSTRFHSGTAKRPARRGQFRHRRSQPPIPATASRSSRSSSCSRLQAATCAAPRFGAGGAASGSFLLAFSMGAVAALLAGACVAPVVIQVVLFSSSLYAAGTRIALALPFCLGIGMAVPWPIAGAGLAALPKPGLWMVRVKQAFGVVILATAAYYGYEAYQLFSNRWVNASDVTASVEEKLKEGWTPSLAGGLAAAEREGKPVLIDMWATWCKNCLTMDKTTLQDPEVRRALEGYVKVKFQAEEP